MAVYTISPCLMKGFAQNELYYFRELLFKFISGPHTVSVDRDGYVIDIYSKIIPNQDIIHTWLTLMSNNPPRFTKIPVSIKGLGCEHMEFLHLCKSTNGQHKMVVSSLQEVEVRIDDDNCVQMDDVKVRLLDKDEAVCELSAINSINITNSQVAGGDIIKSRNLPNGK